MRNFEVGDLYFHNKNYKGAESRFREALQYKPEYPEAIFKLAVSLEKLDNQKEAVAAYQSYLELLPDGPFADPARKAVQRLSSPVSREPKPAR